MIYVLTGPVGAGKSMMATQRVIDYAARGSRVASNYHIDFSSIARRRASNLSRASCIVLPPQPTAADLEALGVGGPTEEKAGLVVIDEAGTFLNSRTWSDADRAKIIRWMLLSRKRRWDMILIVQAVGILDKQIREAVVEVCGRIRRTDRIKVPFTQIKLPRYHIASMRYGTNPNDVIIERWMTRGDESIKCYDTTALFEAQEGSYSVLPATLSKWRYLGPSLLQKWLAWLSGRSAVRKARLKAKHPLVELIQRLPADQRPRHFQRLNQLGAFG